MAAAVYPKAKQAFLNKLIDMDTDDIRVQLIDSADYTYSAAHEFLSDVPGAARVGTSGALDSRTITDGVFDAADEVIPTVSGDPIEALIVYLHTGSDATSRLISYHDGLSLTVNGGNVNVQWNASGIFAL